MELREILKREIERLARINEQLEETEPEQVRLNVETLCKAIPIHYGCCHKAGLE